MLYGSEQSTDVLSSVCPVRAKRRAERACFAAFIVSVALVGAIVFWGPSIHGFLR